MKILREGERCDFSFMFVDISGASVIARANSPRSVERSLDAFEEYLNGKVEERGGEIWTWEGDGGLCAFYDESSLAMCENAVLAGIDAINDMGEFNDELSEVREEIAIKVAVHKGLASFRSSRGRIHSTAINHVAHLMKALSGMRNTMAITGNVYGEINSFLQDEFLVDGELYGIPIYMFPKSDERALLFPALGWGDIERAAQLILKRMVNDGFHPDVILAIGDHGAVFGGILAANLGHLPVAVLPGMPFMWAQSEDSDSGPLSLSAVASGKDVLLVDGKPETGERLRAGKELVLRVSPGDLRTAAPFQPLVAALEADYYAFKLSTEQTRRTPWELNNSDRQ